MRILMIGPDPACSRGGMASVIETIQDDELLNQEFVIDVYGSCISGNIVKRVTYSIFAYIRFALTKQDYDIYHIHMASRGSTFRKGYYVRKAKKNGKKVIIHFHSGDYFTFYDRLSDPLKKIVSKILNTADLAITLSSYWKDKYETVFKLKKCVIIENCINMKKFEPAITDVNQYLHSFIVLSRLGKKKGTYDLIQAVEIVKQKIQDVEVFIAGDGEIEEAKQMVEEKNLNRNIKIIGWINFDEKIEYLRKVSTVILPSYHEGLPMAILEGMACGKAIISTTVGAIPEIVQKENGILIQPGDIKALADAMIECATNTKRVQRMSACNIEQIRREFSTEHMRQALGNCYRSLF